MIVTLTWPEAQVGAFIGCQRQLRALARGRNHRHGYNGADSWTINIEGVAAEFAVAKTLDAFWSDSSDPDYTGDIDHYHVRQTAWQNGGLLLHPDDPDDATFILAVGALPTYRLAGYLLAAEGKRPEFWTEPQSGRPCFKVPQDRLHPFSDLLTIARVQAS